MDRSSNLKRRVILVALGILLLGDLALAAYSWRAAVTERKSMKELLAESQKLQLLRADVDRADRTRHDLPATVAECDRFEASLIPASKGNSAVEAEIDELAKRAGLQIQSINFHHKDAGRNLTQVELEATVSGDYASIVKFMNGLQRASNPYAVESLTLQTEAQQGAATAVHVALQMKTYFRTAA